MKRSYFGLGFLGAFVTIIGLAVMSSYWTILTAVSSLPGEWWGWPISAGISIAGFWSAFYLRASKRKLLRWPLTLPLLSFPVFDSLAYLTLFENDASELIYGVPLVGDLLSAWNFATSTNLSEVLTFVNISSYAFPLALYLSFAIFLVLSLKGFKALSCSNCGANVTVTAAFCGSCGELQSAS